MKTIAAVPLYFFAFIASLIFALFFSFYDIVVAKELLFFGAFGCILLIGTIITLPFIALQRAEQTTSPGIFSLIKRDTPLHILIALFSLLPIITIAMAFIGDIVPGSTKTLFPYLIALIGLELDGMRWYFRRLLTLFDPNALIKLLVKNITLHAREEQFTAMYDDLTVIGKMVFRDIKNDDAAAAKNSIEAMTQATINTISLAEDPSNTLFIDELPRLLSRTCEQLENAITESLGKSLSTIAENSIHSIRHLTVMTAYSYPPFATVPLGCMQRSTESIMQNSSDSILATIACTMLAQDSCDLLDHIDSNDDAVSTFYHEIIDFLTYFSMLMLEKQQNALSKEIILRGIGTIIEKITTPPFNSREQCILLLKKARTALATYKKSPFIQQDLHLIEDIDRLIALKKEGTP